MLTEGFVLLPFSGHSGMLSGYKEERERGGERETETEGARESMKGRGKENNRGKECLKGKIYRESGPLCVKETKIIILTKGL